MIIIWRLANSWNDCLGETQVIKSQGFDSAHIRHISRHCMVGKKGENEVEWTKKD